MQAMILKEPRPVEENPLAAVEVPEPTPGQDDIRVRVRACGVCHTDLHTVEGELDLPRLPIIPGHHIVGAVDQLEANVTRFRLSPPLRICRLAGCSPAVRWRHQLPRSASEWLAAGGAVGVVRLRCLGPRDHSDSPSLGM